jgi:chromosomal replication initiation ATPase DnaA
MRAKDDIRKTLSARGFLGLAQTIAEEQHVELDSMLAPGRMSDAVRARHELWRAIRELGFSYPAIAKIFGVDHTTVMHGVEQATMRAAKTIPPRAAQPTEGA